MRHLTLKTSNDYPLNFLTSFSDSFFDTLGGEQSRETHHISPKLEIVKKEKATFINVDLPGLKKEDIKLDLKDELLTISGERKSTLGENDYSEKSYGRFKRSLKLPKDLDSENLEASYEDGVLLLAIPYKEEIVSKQITINDQSKESLFKKFSE